MRFHKGEASGLDRIGGSPSHIPADYPINPKNGAPLGFAAQFECHPDRLPINDAILLQLYYPDDDVYIPLDDIQPILITKSTRLASPSGFWVGLTDPALTPHGISWRESDDPDSSEVDWNDIFGCSFLRESKSMGTCGFPREIQTGERCLLQLEELPGGFDFGGDLCLVILKPDGSLRVTTV